MGLHVNRHLVQISISYLFPPSALPLSLLTLLLPIRRYVHPCGFFSAHYYLLHQCDTGASLLLTSQRRQFSILFV